MIQEFSEEPKEKLPDRPLECSECKKPITIRYTEIEKGKFTEFSMCNDCPCLKKKLRGAPLEMAEGEAVRAGLACGNCGMTLESFLVGHPLGCSQCYAVFAEDILKELHTRGRLPPKTGTSKKSQLHMGRSPGEVVEISPSLQLIALNEALSEMLKREDYEQAAMIRDQINALTESAEKEKREKKQ
ncbi:UvrB/UvrC motif-containing protein [Criblamydia sequanensis]|uniref:UVR domain-containing protein n=1 Tax=Candidatus Criblamydia sequanensis CRIB-18 TaxID=1437425 RepID=A0A090CZG0_9BACT|nr:UvrB/UvrC motif-containing protein [Criblamydia sequanensis]CDR34256.1 Conserved hypothetical protein [Criblamydia sequanensis CRIB-18]